MNVRSVDRVRGETCRGGGQSDDGGGPREVGGVAAFVDERRTLPGRRAINSWTKTQKGKLEEAMRRWNPAQIPPRDQQHGWSAFKKLPVS